MPSFIHGATPRTVLFANSSISGKLSYNLPVKIDGHLPERSNRPSFW